MDMILVWNFDFDCWGMSWPKLKVLDQEKYSNHTINSNLTWSVHFLLVKKQYFDILSGYADTVLKWNGNKTCHEIAEVISLEKGSGCLYIEIWNNKCIVKITLAPFKCFFIWFLLTEQKKPDMNAKDMSKPPFKCSFKTTLQSSG